MDRLPTLKNVQMVVQNNEILKLQHEIGEKNKEIERLRKEKDWLVKHYAIRRYSHRPDKTKEEIEKEILDQMQKALKEK